MVKNIHINHVKIKSSLLFVDLFKITPSVSSPKLKKVFCLEACVIKKNWLKPIDFRCCRLL